MFLGTACHDPRFMSSRMLKCAGWYHGARVLNVVWMLLRKVAQYHLGGHGMSGHSKSDPACQSPVGVVRPEMSWTWSSVTRILFANVLSHLSCFIMNGICVWFCSVCVSGNSIPPIDMGPYSTAPGRCP